MKTFKIFVLVAVLGIATMSTGCATMLRAVAEAVLMDNCYYSYGGYDYPVYRQMCGGNPSYYYYIGGVQYPVYLNQCVRRVPGVVPYGTPVP